MKQIIPLFTLLLVLIQISAQPVSILKLKQAFKYAKNKDVPEFSGLCFKDESLYSVNDKGKNYLYKLNIDTNNSTFSAEPIEISSGKDFEGICYYKNSFFVVEEKECQLYTIEDHATSLYGTELLSTLKAQNLIYTGEYHNAQIESFSMLSDSTVLIATERNITTIAKVDTSGKILSKTIIPPLHFSDSYLPSSLVDKEIGIKDANSFSDLCVYRGKAYLLEREKKMIYVIDISGDSFLINTALSFKNCIMPCDEYHEYYGAAEGLAVDEKFIYIILDNNGYSNQDQKIKCEDNGRTLFQLYR